MHEEKISVYNYSDPVKFISDKLSYICSKPNAQTINEFCKSAGFNSSATLIDILKRKKSISETSFDKISSALKIDNAELLYFYTLVQKANSKSSRKKLLYDLLLSDMRPASKSIKEINVYRDTNLDLFSHYIYMAILSMSELKDFKAEPEYINNQLIHKLDLDFIDSAIETLVHNKLLVKGENGKYRKSHSIVSTKTDVRREDVDDYYYRACDLAKEAVGLDVLQREFQCFSLPISKEKLPVAKEFIRKCRANLDSLIDDKDKDTVYQLNLMMFPLTHSVSSISSGVQSNHDLESN